MSSSVLIPYIHTHIQKPCRDRDGLGEQESLGGASDSVPYAGSESAVLVAMQQVSRTLG